MSTKSKNIVLLIFVLLLACVLFAIIIYDAVLSNKENEPLEIYIDTTPIDYSDDDSVIYAFKFSYSITSIMASLGGDANSESLQNFISELLEAMSIARIPSVKLGTIADAINSYSEDIIYYFTDDSALTDEEIEEMIKTTKMQHIADFTNDFFNKTTLTEEEFSSIIYQYMLTNSTTDYKKAMSKLGKEDYVTFISNTFYLVNTMGDIMSSEGGVISATTLQAVIYELGNKYIEILDNVGLDAIKTVLGFSWNYTGTDTRVTIINTYAEALSNKLSYCFGILGYTMKELNIADIEYITEYLSMEDGKAKNDMLIYTQSRLANAVLRGMTQSLKYLEGTGVTSLDTLFPSLKNMIIDAYMLRTTLQSEDAVEEEKSAYLEAFDDFVEGLIYFSNNELTLEEVQNMTVDETYQALLDNAKNISNIQDTLDDFVFNIVYVWMVSIINGENLEAE